jgi:hypothetical protein
MKSKLNAMLIFGPVSCWIIGFALNKICMGMNGGMMPVMWPTHWGLMDYDPNHIYMTAHTHLNFLGDWINQHHNMGSLGDKLMDIYDATWLPGIVAYVARTFKFGGSDYRS